MAYLSSQVLVVVTGVCSFPNSPEPLLYMISQAFWMGLLEFSCCSGRFGRDEPC